jgi:hypothetical protein
MAMPDRQVPLESMRTVIDVVVADTEPVRANGKFCFHDSRRIALARFRVVIR